jgi:hypothetical protein
MLLPSSKAGISRNDRKEGEGKSTSMESIFDLRRRLVAIQPTLMLADVKVSDQRKVLYLLDIGFVRSAVKFLA